MACEVVFPPSANWYLAQIADSFGSWLAYGCRGRIVLFSVSETRVTYSAQFDAHKENTSALSFIRQDDPASPRLVTFGEEGEVKLWRLSQQTGVVPEDFVSLLDKHDAHHKMPVTCGSSTAFGDMFVLSGDLKGGLCVWNVGNQSVSPRKVLEREAQVTCVRFSPTRADLAVVTHANGAAHVVSAAYGKLAPQLRIRVCDDKIDGLSWCPAVENPDRGHPEFAVTSSDKIIRLFRTDSERCLLSKKIPNKTGSKGGGGGLNSARLFVTCCWLKPDLLLTSSISGDLLAWTVCFDSNSKLYLNFQVWDGENRDVHSRNITNIVSCLVNGQLRVVTHAMDKQILLWSENKLLSCLSTLGASSHFVDVSPIDGTSLAVACNDGFLRVWNSSELGCRIEDYQMGMRTHWLGHKTKVSIVCWHPHREGSLGFGTEDGRVGIYDIYSKNKRVINSASFHRQTVYSLSFGPDPVCKDGTAALWLYSCGGECHSLAHNPARLEQEAVHLQNVIRGCNPGTNFDCRHSELQWSPDLSLLALGNKSGGIDIFDAKFAHVCSLQAHPRPIYCAVWHPCRLLDGSDVENPFLIATCCVIDTTIRVTDVRDAVNTFKSRNPEESYQPPVISHKLTELVGHSRKLYRLDWSPFEAMKLLSTSMDGSAQIWNVKSGMLSKGIANFRINLNQAHVTCAKFSRVHPDFVFASGNDFSVRCWRISQQLESNPPAKMYQSKFVPSSTTVLDSSKEGPETDNAALTNGNHEPELPLRRQPSDLSIGSGDASSAKTAKNRNKKVKSLLRHAASLTPNKEEALVECRAIFSKLTGSADERKKPFPPSQSHLGLYMGRLGAFNAVDDELRRCSDAELKCDLLLLKGDIEAAVDFAIKNGIVSTKVAAAASLAGFEVWERCVSALISQSVAQSEWTDAVQYMLMLNRTREAIDLLLNHNKFREAIAIAVTRLPADDPAVAQIFSKWAVFQETAGNVECACSCYLAISDFESAARSVTLRNSSANFALAVDLLLHGGQLEKAAHYARQSVFHALMAGDFTSATDMSEREQTFKFMRYPVATFRSVYSSIKELGLDVTLPNDSFVSEVNEPEVLEITNKTEVIKKCMDSVCPLLQDSKEEDINQLIEDVSKMGGSMPTIKPRLTNVKLALNVAFECCLLAIDSRMQRENSDRKTQIEKLLCQLRPIPPIDQ